MAATVEHFGSLDVLVANADGPPPGRAIEVDDEQLLVAISANLLTSVRLVRAAVPHMQALVIPLAAAAKLRLRATGRP